MKWAHLVDSLGYYVGPAFVWLSLLYQTTKRQVNGQTKQHVQTIEHPGQFLSNERVTMLIGLFILYCLCRLVDKQRLSQDMKEGSCRSYQIQDDNTNICLFLMNILSSCQREQTIENQKSWRVGVI